MATKPFSILFVSSEMQGLAKTGGLADVTYDLPQALQQSGNNLRVVLPYYQHIKLKHKAHKCYDLTLPVQSDSPNIHYQLFTLEYAGLTVYLIHCPHYFDRQSLYGEHNLGYADNGERFAFFCAATLHALKTLKWKTDIIHCNDWHTGLIPFLLKTRYANDAFFHRTSTVLTVHNAAFQGTYPRNQLWMIPELLSHFIGILHQEHNDINLLKCGIYYADKITAVSPNYATELLTDLGSHSIGDVFRSRASDLSGVLNGCNYRHWDPKKDPLIPHHYTVDNLKNKALCKQHLQTTLNLATTDTPLYGMICRLTKQKGVHLLIPALYEFLRHRVQVVIMGTGDPDLAVQLHALATHFPDHFVFIPDYTEEKAHHIEAGADFFLMPSLFEPCGLNQIYSLAYGTIPVVRDVGGLRDTIVDYHQDPNNATGFIFKEPTTLALLNTMRHSLIFYLQEPKEVQRLRENGMKTKFLWSTAVKEYEAIYQESLKNASSD